MMDDIQSPPPTLRLASAADADALAQLLGELGYPAEARELPARLDALEQHPGAVAFVAESGGRVVGVVTCHVIPAIHSTPPVAQLTALVVSESARGRGVGRLLVARVEEWAAQRGAAKISLTSALRREAAHRFYEGIGYTRTGLRLAKDLTSS